VAARKKPVARATLPPKVAKAPLTPEEKAEAARLAYIEEQTRALKLVRHAIAARKSRDSLIDFAKFMKPDPEDLDDVERSLYRDAVHHRIIAREVENVIAGKCLRLAISVPPQHGKSEITSRKGPAWYMGKCPTNHLMFGTYSQDFAEKFGNEVRDLIDNPRFRQVFPNVVLATGSKSRARMNIEHYGGSLLFVGRGGMGSGNPASIFIVDDPIKDDKEAQSATIRDDVWNWYVKTVEARCTKFSAQIIIQTRWHEDDLIGRLTDTSNPHYNERVAKQFRVVNLPAIINTQEAADLTGLEMGSALWPERFPLETLEIKQALDPEAFSALYMGQPTPPGGAFFKSSEIFEYGPKDIPGNTRPYMTGDLAVGTKKTNDQTCVGIWRLDELDNLYLDPNLYWERKSADASVERIIDMMMDVGPMDTWWEKGLLDKSIGPFFEKRALERKCYHGITSLPISGDKGFRAASIRGRMRMGKVFFPKFAPWWPKAKEQMLKFTGSGEDLEDDFVDMCSLIGQALGSQLKASKPSTSNNVVPIRSGTLAWVKNQSRIEAQERRRAAMKRGF
jgi:phage terminase large subunit-like protein